MIDINEGFELDKKVQKIIDKKRKKIPERYNQALLIEQLFNPAVDWLVSISNRTDGKSYNYVDIIFELCYQLDLGFTLLSRTYMLRQAYQSFLFKLIEKSGRKMTDLLFKNTDDYLMVIYKQKTIGIITDLNNATDLKYHSNFIVDFPIIIYDEFLALEGDYLPDEWEKLQTIYESINRYEGDIPYIKDPKIVLLGNAVNFSSPLLAFLDLFNKLEAHPLNEARIYDNIALEMRRNEHANEDRNLRAFKSYDDAMTTGQFKINTFKIIGKDEFYKLKYIGKVYYIKLQGNQYIEVTYDPEHLTNVTLSVKTETKTGDYEYCLELKDKKEGIIFLKDTYFSPTQTKKYDNGFYNFENAFSKDVITNNPIYNTIKINKCTSIHNAMTKPISMSDKKDEIFKDRYLEETKKSIMRRMMM